MEPQFGVKYDQEKPKWDLLPLEELEATVRVLTFGAKKYAPDNWRKVPDAKNRYYSAMMRHIKAWQCGEAYDKETNEHHLDHAMCCLVFLRHFAVKDDANKEKQTT